jgi:hypothetical protein
VIESPLVKMKRQKFDPKGYKICVLKSGLVSVAAAPAAGSGKISVVGSI